MSTRSVRCASFARTLGLLVACIALRGLQAQTATNTGTPNAGAPNGATQPPAGAAGAPLQALAADVISIQDIARLEGQGESVLRGYGLVMGLKGTGDKGTDAVLARPLVELYNANGLPLPDLKSVAGAKAVAVVMLECRIPREGARKNDQFDVHVTCSNNATSLAGGRLVLAPLLDPRRFADPALTPVWGYAFGPVDLENPQVTTSGVVRIGGRLSEDIRMEPIGNPFMLILDPPYRSYSVAETIARVINGLQPDLDDGAAPTAPVAKPIDDMTVQITIPQSERANSKRFISEILTAKFSPSLLKLGAMVIINSRSGSIIMTADVEFSAVTITHRALQVTTLTPPPVPSPANPITSVTKSSSVRTTDRPSDRARLADLLSALKQLDVPFDDQVALITEIHKTGRLYARVIID